MVQGRESGADRNLLALFLDTQRQAEMLALPSICLPLIRIENKEK